MARKGNQTCVQLHNVAKTGIAHHTSSLVVKGIWYPQHFSLAVTDGVNAWKIEATEAFVTQRASDMKITATQYVDKAHLHLGHGHKSSLYSLHCLGPSPNTGAQLLCTPRDGRDLNMELTINLPLKVAPVLDLAFEVVEFLMHANQELEEKLERKSRTYERTKATIEQSVEELQCQKAQLEYEKSQLEVQVRMIKGSELKPELAIVPVPPDPSALKRKFDAGGGGEDTAPSKRGSQQQRPLWAPLPPPPIPAKEAGAGGAQAPITENGSPAKEEFSGCDGQWNKSTSKLPTGLHNVEICKTSAPNTVPRVGKKRGRKPKGTVVQAPDTDARLPTLARTLACGGPQRDALTRDQLSEHRIEEQSERAIKLLEPYTRQLVNPRALTKSALGAPKGPKTAGRKRGTTNTANNNNNNEHPKLHLRQPSEDTSTQSSVALPLVERPTTDTDTNTPAAPTLLPKEFSVINADFYDFDNERSKYVMGLGQYWALYDNQDGMPRFYGRIVNLVLDPFQVRALCYQIIPLSNGSSSHSDVDGWIAGGGGVAGAAPTGAGILRAGEVRGLIGGVRGVQEGYGERADTGSILAPRGGGGRREEEDVPDLSSQGGGVGVVQGLGQAAGEAVRGGRGAQVRVRAGGAPERLRQGERRQGGTDHQGPRVQDRVPLRRLDATPLDPRQGPASHVLAPDRHAPLRRQRDARGAARLLRPRFGFHARRVSFLHSRWSRHQHPCCRCGDHANYL